jgi:hypothetical protein
MTVSHLVVKTAEWKADVTVAVRVWHSALKMAEWTAVWRAAL